MVDFNNHAFKGLDESLKDLFTRLSRMGGEVQLLLDLLPEGLQTPNPEIAAAAKAIDKKINAAELENDKAVADILGKFRLVGEDLRFLLGSIKVAAVLERLADRVKNCNKRLAKINTGLDAELQAHIAKAAGMLKQMVPPSLEQVINYRPLPMEELQAQEKQIENAYRAVVLRLGALSLEQAETNHILFIAKNLDQAAGMAVEIAKMGHYICLGEKYSKS